MTYPPNHLSQSMSDPALNSTVFDDNSSLTSKVVASGLASNLNRSKPPVNITTQLHTPLTSRPVSMTTSIDNSSSSTNIRPSSSSMEAMNRSKISVDPLATLSGGTRERDASRVSETDLQEPDPSPDLKVQDEDEYTKAFLGKIRWWYEYSQMEMFSHTYYISIIIIAIVFHQLLWRIFLKQFLDCIY